MEAQLLVQLGVGSPLSFLAALAHVGLGGAPHLGGGSTPLVHVGPIQYVVPLLEPSRTFQNLSDTL